DSAAITNVIGQAKLLQIEDKLLQYINTFAKYYQGYSEELYALTLDLSEQDPFMRNEVKSAYNTKFTE
ncbi:4604_t:CDS:2, partial [Scutellospora calospora]